MRAATLVMCFLLSITWAEKEIGELLDTARDRLRCVSDPKCIDKVGVQRLLHVTNLKVAHFNDLSMVVAHHLLHGDSSCTVHLPTLDIVEDEVMRAIGTEDLAGILRIFKRILKDDGKKKCTGIDDILKEMNLPPSSYSAIEWVRAVLSVLMQHIMKGYCLQETVSSGDSLDNLFNHYGDACSPYLSAKGLEKMMNDLEITANDHDHQHHRHHHHDHLHHEHDNHNHECDHHPHHDHEEHEHDCDHDHHSKNHKHNHDHSDINHTHYDHSYDENEHTEDRKKMHNNTSEENQDQHNNHNNENKVHSDQNNDKDGKLVYVHSNSSVNNSSYEHSINQTNPNTPVAEKESSKLEIKPAENRSEILENIYVSKLSDLWHPTTLASEESNIVSKILPPPTSLSRNIPPEECLSAESLVSRYGSDRVTISKSEFLTLCPVIVNQRVGDACSEPTVAINLPSKKEVYGYGSISVAVLCLASLSGVLLLPLMRQSARHYIIAGFQGLAFSTLASDALLHLLPEVLGLHSHGHSHGHSHSHEEGSFPEPYAQLLLGVFATIYVLFMIEAIFCAISGRSKESNGHGHSHGLTHNHPPPLSLTEPTLISVKSQSTTQLQMSSQSCTSLDTEIIDMDTLKKPPNLMVNQPVFCGLTSMALVITLGDALHNFGDGLAIGAAFSANIRGGLSTAAAGLCHELPHELGDFVVLLSSGLSYSKALVINFLSSLTCFAGLYVGILVGDNSEARKWVMAATASTFLYVAMAEMIPELREHRHGSPVKMLLAKNIGIILGVTIMCIISIYENQMS